ncbi:MAG TPA: MarC family protein [Nanoarchaeota archaeon]|nr:MarC family protein [Nanoarchaeota archaeon]
MLAELLAAFFALFTVIDPVGNSLCYLGLTTKHTPEEKKKLANKAILISAIILFLFLFVGNYIFEFFSISTGSLKLAGGVMLFLIGIKMVFGNTVCEGGLDRMTIAVVPLAMPFVAGPGVITTAMIMSEKYGLIAAIAGVALNLIISWIFYRKADAIYKVIGKQWGDVFSRIIGVVLLALAMEFGREGIKILFAI